MTENIFFLKYNERSLVDIWCKHMGNPPPPTAKTKNKKKKQFRAQCSECSLLLGVPPSTQRCGYLYYVLYVVWIRKLDNEFIKAYFDLFWVCIFEKKPLMFFIFMLKREILYIKGLCRIVDDHLNGIYVKS